MKYLPWFKLGTSLGYRPSSFTQAFFMLMIAAFPFAAGLGWEDSQEGPKWALLYIFSLLAFLFSGFSIPHLKRDQFLPLIAVVASFALSTAINPKGFIEQQILDWICFGIIALWVFDQSLSSDRLMSDLERANLLSLFFVLIFNLLHFSNINAAFGHRNFFAEFLGLSLIMQLDHFSRTKSGYSRLIISFVGVFALALFMRQFCLSATLALLLGASFYLFFKKTNTQLQQHLCSRELYIY